MEPRLARLSALDEGESGEREELFSAWRTYFERIAERGPTAMVFEDIQWADAGLLDFIESILEWSRGSQILIVTLARPELADRRASWGVGQRNLQSLHLEPLDASLMEELVRGFVRGIPDEGVTRVVERAEGVPLYAVETVRMLVDRGALVAAGEVYETVGDMGDLDVPETLQALIAARLDALPTEQRALLQDAAVLGKSFPREALAAVSGAEAASLEPMLRDLIRREFLLHEADPRSPERGQYGFVQSLIREVVYGQLAKADRRKRHLATAHHLESLGDESLAGAVASHYVEAYRSTSAGPEAEALAARARDWLAQAADRALSIGSPEQALGYVEQALEITAPGAERAALLERASNAAAMSSLEEASERYFSEAIAAFAAEGDPVGEGRVLSRGLRFREPSESLLERTAASIDAVEALGAGAAPDVLALLYRSRASTARMMGDNELALGYIERALPILEELDDREALGESMALKAIVLYALGRQYESRVLLEGAQQMAEATASARVSAMVLMMLGSLLSDEPRKMFQASLDSAEAARRAGDRPGESMALGNALELAIDLGEWQAADTIATELDERPNLPTISRDAVSMCRAMLAAYRGDDDAASSFLTSAQGALTSGLIDQRTWYLRTNSLVNLLAGRLDEAIAEGTRAVEEDPLGGNAPTALAGTARAALWKPDVDSARRALEAMAPLRGPWVDAVRDGTQAGIDGIAGRRDAAIDGFRRAIDGFRAMELGFDVALTVVDAVVVLGSPGVSVGELERTGAYLTELSAKPLLERLEDATVELHRG